MISLYVNLEVKLHSSSVKEAKVFFSFFVNSFFLSTVKWIYYNCSN